MSATLADISRRLAGRSPQTAVQDASARLSDRDLDALARGVAAALDERRVGRAEPVAVLAPKSCGGVAAALGVALAGRVYAPLDATLPPELLAAQLGALRPAAVLATPSQTGLAEALAGAAPTAVGGALVLARVAGPPSVLPEAAYVIFTSGSTGAPKGVVVRRSNLDAFTSAARDRYGLGPSDRLYNPAPLHFDFSILDVFALTRAGGALICPPPGPLLPGDLLAYLKAARPTVLAGVPSFFTWLAGPRPPSPRWFPQLQRVIFGGEAFPIAALRRWMAAYPAATFINTYGPTETTVFVSSHQLDAPPAAPPPIGAPFEGVSLVVVSADGRLAPHGETGELWIGGEAFLAAGYLDAEATEKSFLASPFGDGLRYYRSGDLARQTAEGLCLVGRVDSQVKIAGRRIELGAVEQAFCALDGVADAAAAVICGADGAPEAIACYVASLRAPEALRSEAAERLPTYMLPRELHVAPDLPRGRSGKLDRRSLARVEPADAG